MKIISPKHLRLLRKLRVIADKDRFVKNLGISVAVGAVIGTVAALLQAMP